VQLAQFDDFSALVRKDEAVLLASAA
jgi:hypothetical protein